MSTSLPMILSNVSAGIESAAAILSSGGLVAFPTETVYGLGADARNGEAVASVFEAKGRPTFNPLIVHVPDVTSAQKFGHWTPQAETLATAFWPGPLTLVLPLREGHGLSSLVTAGLDSVAIRVPAHPTAQAILAAFGGPVAAPSANPSGRISPTSADHVVQGLGQKVAAILDDGPCLVGLESTIVGLNGPATLLRAGGVTSEDIEGVLGAPLHAATDSKISAPGQMLSHYAPVEKVRLNATQARQSEVFLGFGDMDCDINLSRHADLKEAAANLFEHLHVLDRLGQPIAVAPIPRSGLGLAINDRLTRAAAPKA
ncbi:MAG: L-threonylcarbamoyladenylate synthase [Roseobacter sp.]